MTHDEAVAVRPVVLHMRNGDTVAYSPPGRELPTLIDAIARRGYSGNLAINDDAGGQRLINLAAVDWIEVKGVPGAASAS